MKMLFFSQMDAHCDGCVPRLRYSGRCDLNRGLSS